MHLIVIILLFQHGLELFLDYLNARHFSDPVPEGLEDVYDEEEYRKSQAYKKANFKYQLIKSSFSLILILSFLLLGGFGAVDAWVRELTDHPVLQALLFFGLILLGTDLLTTPFSYYHTFVIEERFGFNRSSRRLFFMDKLKGWLLLVILGGGMLGILVFLFQWAGPDFWWYAWIVVAVVSLVMSFFYSKLIVPIFNKQTPLEDGSLKSRIEAYAARVGFSLKQIFVVDGSKRSTKANAYFSGFGKEKRITLYDTLLQDLEEEEVVAVLAHEVGHYKKNHILYGFLVSVISTGLALFLLSLFISEPELSMAIGVSQPSFHAGLLGFGLLYGPVSLLSGLFMNYLSRRFEYQADGYARQTYAAEPLAASLKKLTRNNLSNLTPHPAYVFVHYSHPPLKDRIRALLA